MEQAQPSSRTLSAEMQSTLLPDEQVLFVAHSDLQKIRMFLTAGLIIFFVFCAGLGIVVSPDVEFQEFAVVLIKSVQFQLAFLLTLFSQIFFIQMHKTFEYVITNKNFRWGYRIWGLDKFINNSIEITPQTQAHASMGVLVVKSNGRTVKLGPIQDVSDLTQKLNLAAEQSKALPSS